MQCEWFIKWSGVRKLYLRSRSVGPWVVRFLPTWRSAIHTHFRCVLFCRRNRLIFLGFFCTLLENNPSFLFHKHVPRNPSGNIPYFLDFANNRAVNVVPFKQTFPHFFRYGSSRKYYKTNDKKYSKTIVRKNTLVHCAKNINHNTFMLKVSPQYRRNMILTFRFPVIHGV